MGETPVEARITDEELAAFHRTAGRLRALPADDPVRLRAEQVAASFVRDGRQRRKRARGQERADATAAVLAGTATGHPDRREDAPLAPPPAATAPAAPSVSPPSPSRTSGRSAASASGNRVGKAHRPPSSTRSTVRAGPHSRRYAPGSATIPACRIRWAKDGWPIPSRSRTYGGQSTRMASAQRA
ncbi:hypothetical protein OG552_33090 [Streptomyces sp. NBC_01476]|uniref:hypothetical protein n=1 Tax=Streptomyces sp. NBC_01476 TaxID=2903881 RepID=UPI002E36DF3A|nr:hypothetical protein [Streptomyces sp. NBC_01476]